MYVWVVFQDHFLNFSIEIPFVQYKSFKPQSLKCFWTVKFYTSSQYYYYFYGLFIPYTLHSVKIIVNTMNFPNTKNDSVHKHSERII